MANDKQGSSKASSNSAVKGNYTLQAVTEHSRMEEEVCKLSHQVMGCLWPCTQAQWKSLTRWSGWWSVQSRGYWEALWDTHTHTQYYTQEKQFIRCSSHVSTPSLSTQREKKDVWHKPGDEWGKGQKHAESYHGHWAECAVELHQLHWWPDMCIFQSVLVLPLRSLVFCLKTPAVTDISTNTERIQTGYYCTFHVKCVYLCIKCMTYVSCWIWGRNILLLQVQPKRRYLIFLLLCQSTGRSS